MLHYTQRLRGFHTKAGCYCCTGTCYTSRFGQRAVRPPAQCNQNTKPCAHPVAHSMEEALEALAKLGLPADALPPTPPGKISTSCCANCLGGADDDKKLQKCGRCKAVFYCCRACQKEHWPTHKSMCSQLPQLKEAIKQTVRENCGEQFRKHMDAWAKMNSPAFNMIAHGMLRTPEQRRNFVVGLVTEYRPEHDPPFEIKETPRLPLRSLRDTDPDLYFSVTSHMQDAPPRAPNVVAYMVLTVTGMDFPPRVMPLVKQEDMVVPLAPAAMVKIVNAHILD